jgi:chemotaxis signal transduction protein
MNPFISASIPLSSEDLEPQVETCKAAVFQIADHWFALPATAILKVISASALADVGVQADKLFLWENHPLIQLDLHRILPAAAERSLQHEPQWLNSRNYILIVWSQTGDRCAVAVDKLPVLLDIPLSKAQILPSHYRQTISSIAKYMIALPHKGAVLTVLLLDLQQVLDRQRRSQIVDQHSR